MGVPQPDISTSPPVSALHALFRAHAPPADSPHSLDHHNLALQIAHNLRHQHLWTGICLHTHSPQTSQPLSRPILSGVPPSRLYVHPDEQIALLQQQKDEGKTGMPRLRPQREWVLPSHLREKWSLRRFGEMFDAVGVVPDARAGEMLFLRQQRAESEEEREEDGEGNEGGETRSWRERAPKRMLLATLDDDSTIVYYIVHDGTVKPRQN